MLSALALCGVNEVVLAAERIDIEPDSLYKTETIEGVSVAVRMPKQHFGLKRQPISASVVGEATLEREQIQEYFTTFCAAAVIVAVPITALFMWLQKYYVQGVTGGAVKG